MVVSLAALFDAQAGRCGYCGVAMTKRAHRGNSVTRDHRVPKVAGGSNLRSNLLGACRRCNEIKGDRSEREFRRWHPSAHVIESLSPMAGFDARVRRKAPHGPHHRPPVTTIRADHEAAWRDLHARFPPRPPPRPVGFCSGCRFFAALAPGHPPVCQWRWQRGDWHVATPLTSAADSCHEHAAR